MKTILCRLAFTVAVLPSIAHAQSITCAGDRWPEFRGGTAGRSAAKALPTQWSDESGVTWRVDLAGVGQSSPVVHRGRVIVTSVQGPQKDLCSVSCYRTADGLQLWCRTVQSSAPQKLTKMVSQAAPTPAIDAERIYAFFESGDFLALSHNGEILWHRSLTKDYGAIQGNHGLGSSVVLSSHGVLVLVDHSGPSYLVSLDKSTGTPLWRAERESRVSWSTPIVRTIDGLETIIASSNGAVHAYDAADGRQLWHVSGVSGNTAPSPSVLAGAVLVGCSKGAGAVLLRLPNGKPEAVPIIRWTANPARPSGFSSPIAFDGGVLILNKAGSLGFHDIESGEQSWRQRIGQGCWASPIVAGDLVYYFGKSGTTSIVRPGASEAEIISMNKLTTEATVYGVAAVDGMFLVRETAELYAIATSNPDDSANKQNAEEKANRNR